MLYLLKPGARPDPPPPLPHTHASPGAAAKQDIQDRTQTNLVNLRRTIYLTIMSALDFEEAGHKLLKMVGGCCRPALPPSPCGSTP